MLHSHIQSETKSERPLMIVAGYANSLTGATIPWIGQDIAIRIAVRAASPHPYRWPMDLQHIDQTTESQTESLVDKHGGSVQSQSATNATETAGTHDDAAREADGAPSADASALPSAAAAIAVDEAGHDGPDLSLLSEPVRPAPAFPVEALPALLRGLVVPLADRRFVNVGFVTTATLVTVAGALGTAAHLQISPDYSEATALWGLVIAKPTLTKTGAMRLSSGVLTKLGAPAAAPDGRTSGEVSVDGFVAEERQRRLKKLIRDGLARGDDDFSNLSALIEDRPTTPGTYTSNSLTLAGILDKIQAQPRGILLELPEIVGLFKTGLARTDEGRGTLLMGYDGDPFVRDVHGARRVIPALLLSMLGGTQPDRLKRLVGDDDDGLLSRCLISWPEVDRPVGLPTRAAEPVPGLEPVLRHVLAQPAGADAFSGHPIQLSDHARRAFEPADRRWAWAADDTEGMMASTYGRARQAALRLSLVLEVIEYALADKRGLPRYVNEASMRAAIALLDMHYLPSAARVFDHVGQGPDPDADLRRIAKYIARHADRAGRFNLKALRESPGAACARNAALWEEAVFRLEAAGCVRRAPQPKRAGRSRGDYIAHPAFIAAAAPRR